MDYPVLDARATGARIRELRKARHLTVEEVARFMGFESEQAVYKWQRGDSLPTVDNLYALSRLFGTTVDDILVGSIERDASPSFSVLWGIHANLVYECITYYIYAYQLRCPKQDVLRTSKLLPKVVICINIIRYTQLGIWHVLTSESRN